VQSETEKLRADLKRYTTLRAWANDKKAREMLSELIEETADRLRQIAIVANDR